MPGLIKEDAKDMKKIKAKDRRNAQQAEKMNRVKAADEKREQERLEREEREELEKQAKAEMEKQRAFDAEVSRIEAENPSLSKKKKSNAKAAGLKSTFVLDKDTLLMTGFGRGNEAVPEKHIADGKVTDISESPKLDVRITDDRKKFAVSGRQRKDAQTDNPLFSRKTAGMDQLKCKGKLERMYFGQEFSDNMHIQLIYQILDIEKILAVHVNNAVFELNNLLREEDGNKQTDVVANIFEETYKKFSNVTEKSDNKKAYWAATRPETYERLKSIC